MLVTACTVRVANSRAPFPTSLAASAARCALSACSHASLNMVFAAARSVRRVRCLAAVVLISWGGTPFLPSAVTVPPCLVGHDRRAWVISDSVEFVAPVAHSPARR